MQLPFRFGYIPYPLWRRRFPPVIRPALNPLWDWIYPAQEDRHPPQDAAAMADYLVRFHLLPDSHLRAIYEALKSSPAEIEITPETPPKRHVNGLVRLPAQWEPMQAVIINWPVMYPPVWELHAQMAEAIAPVAEVIITVPAPMWGHAVWLFLERRGNLRDLMQQVRLFCLPTDDIWARDYGPIIGYDSAKQRVVLDAIYDHLPNFPQKQDDFMPVRWAAHMDMPLHLLQLHTEGGNLWTDGAGTFIMSRQIFNRNPFYTPESLGSYLASVLEYHKLIITPYLTLESTGHVDLLVKPVNANTLMVSSARTPVSAQQLRETYQLFQQETNARGEPYRLIELPTPPPYFNWFVYPIRRSYTNALTINGRVLIPAYGIPQDQEALRIYRQTLPDYEIVTIDCSVGVNGGGAVHCMTREVPANISVKE